MGLNQNDAFKNGKKEKLPHHIYTRHFINTHYFTMQLTFGQKIAHKKKKI